MNFSGCTTGSFVNTGSSALSLRRSRVLPLLLVIVKQTPFARTKSRILHRPAVSRSGVQPSNGAGRIMLCLPSLEQALGLRSC